MRLYRERPSGTVDRARQLRRDASEPERRLLRALRGALPDLKWRHQAPVGPFYADILCLSEALVIEVDGDTHAETAGYDAARSGRMKQEGLRVIRFSNAEVMEDLDGVLESISLSLREREGAHSAKPSGKGEGDAQRKGDPA